MIMVNLMVSHKINYRMYLIIAYQNVILFKQIIKIIYAIKF